MPGGVEPLALERCGLCLDKSRALGQGIPGFVHVVELRVGHRLYKVRLAVAVPELWPIERPLAPVNSALVIAGAVLGQSFGNLCPGQDPVRRIEGCRPVRQY